MGIATNSDNPEIVSYRLAPRNREPSLRWPEQRHNPAASTVKPHPRFEAFTLATPPGRAFPSRRWCHRHVPRNC